MDGYCDVPNSDTKIPTLVDLLRLRAEQPNQCGYTFLVDGEMETVSVPYVCMLVWSLCQPIHHGLISPHRVSRLLWLMHR
jgi:hypothetical protein